MTPWTNAGAGAPNSREASETATLPNAAVLGMEYPVPVTEAVSGWVSNPAGNFGLAFLVDGGNAGGTSVWFASSQAMPGQGARPRLEVTFELPD